MRKSLFDSCQENSDRKPDGVSLLKSGQIFHSVQSSDVGSSQAQRQLANDPLHEKTSKVAIECRKNGDSTCEISDSGIARTGTRDPAQVPVKSAVSALDWILNPEKPQLRRSLELHEETPEIVHNRIASRLVQIEAHEPEAEFRDSYRISWLIVRYCFTGEAVECTPQELATYKVLGCHPDHVWPRVVARRQALLGHPTFAKFSKKTPLPLPQEKEKSA